MAKDSLSSNPVASHNKALKARAIKRSKQAQQSIRDEKLSTRSTAHLERRIGDLKHAKQSNGGHLSERDGEELARLEREVGMIAKAKKRKGVVDEPAGTSTGTGNGSAPSHRHTRDDGDGQAPVLGKRTRPEFQNKMATEGRGRDQGRADSTNPNFAPMQRSHRFRNHRPSSLAEDSSDTDPDVRDIPMPKDVEHMPPPRRRTRPPPVARRDGVAGATGSGSGTGAQGRQRDPAAAVAAASASAGPAQTVYESKPVVRDLKKEATKFVPAAVQARMKVARAGGLGGDGSMSGTGTGMGGGEESTLTTAAATGEGLSSADEVARQVRELKAMVEDDFEDDD